MRIMLDLDGVLVDFVGGMCLAHAHTDPYGDPRNHGVFDMPPMWGMSNTKFWKPTKNAEWWAGLDWMPDGYSIYATCVEAVGVDNICILTACSCSPQCAAGKMMWMQKNLPGVAWLAGPSKANGPRQ